MGETTGISWTDHTFNPWTGCAKVSPGCTNCYAEGLATRFAGSFGGWGVGQPRKRTSAANWRQPLRWNKAAAQAGVRRRVFCASLGDWLDPEVPVEWLADLLELIASTPRLDWQLLSKRPELWRERLEAAAAFERSKPLPLHFGPASNWLAGNAPANVWIGTTVEDQRRADERIPALLSIPARVRFLSMEPLLEAVDLQTQLGGAEEECRVPNGWHGIDWVIVGGESGPNARPFDVAWARSIVRQCRDAGVAVFVKQVGDRSNVPVTAHHGADLAEWPEDLRVQEFPC